MFIEEKDFHKLLERAVEKLSKQVNRPLDRWIDGEEAMQKLRVKSTTTLQRLRDNGKIRFFQDPEHRKHILYDRESIDEYLDKHAHDTF